MKTKFLSEIFRCLRTRKKAEAEEIQKMMKNEIIIFIVIVFTLITCDNKKIKNECLSINENVEVCKIKNGYVIKQFFNKTPNGRYIYFDSDNHIKRIEWYSNNSIPYYSYNIDKEFYTDSYNENYSYFSEKSLIPPKLTSIIDPTINFSEIQIKFLTPINKTLVEIIGRKKIYGTKMNVFENTTHIFINDTITIQNLYLKVTFLGKDNKVLKIIDSVKVP